jgi:hypothetical protein
VQGGRSPAASRSQSAARSGNRALQQTFGRGCRATPPPQCSDRWLARGISAAFRLALPPRLERAGDREALGYKPVLSSVARSPLSRSGNRRTAKLPAAQGSGSCLRSHASRSQSRSSSSDDGCLRRERSNRMGLPPMNDRSEACRKCRVRTHLDVSGSGEARRVERVLDAVSNRCSRVGLLMSS